MNASRASRLFALSHAAVAQSCEGIGLVHCGPLSIAVVDVLRLGEVLSSEARESLVRVLTSAERDRLEELRFCKRQREWLGGRLALKSAVCDWSKRHGRSIRPLDVEAACVSSGPRAGAPCVAQPCQVSISHSGRWAMAAASRAPVGLDIERVRGLPAALSESAFSASERRSIALGTRGTRSLTSEQRGALFWACKEALLKSWGRGLTFGMQRFCIEECEVGGGFSWRWAHQPEGFARTSPSRVDVGAGYALAIHWEHLDERGFS